jgi:hypothetical protein
MYLFFVFWKLEFGTVDMGAAYDCHQLPPITHAHRRIFSNPHENGVPNRKEEFSQVYEWNTFRPSGLDIVFL